MLYLNHSIVEFSYSGLVRKVTSIPVVPTEAYLICIYPNSSLKHLIELVSEFERHKVTFIRLTEVVPHAAIEAISTHQ